MYSFELNIGSWATPTVGGGWVASSCFYDNAKLINQRDGESLRFIKKLTGQLKFYGTEYDALVTLSADYLQVPLRIKIDSTVIFTGNIQLFGKSNTLAKTADLSVADENDLYTKIKANLNMKFPNTGNQATSTSFTIEWDTWQDHLGQGFLDGIIGTNIPPDDYAETEETVASIAAWDSGKAYIEAQEIDTDLWQGDFADCFSRKNSKSYVCIQSNTNKDPETEPTYWALLDNAGFAGYKQERGDFNNEDGDFTYDSVNYYYHRASLTTGAFSRVMNKAFRVFSIIKECLRKISTDIDIYETTGGGNTGFFPYLENIHLGSNGGYLFYHYFSDKINEIEDITLNDLLEFVKICFDAEWKIEGTTFVFRHISEAPSNVGAAAIYDFTTYKNKDWTVYDQETKIEDKIQKETWKIGDSQKQDFENIEVVYENDYENNKDFSTNFETDIKWFLTKDSGKAIVLCYKLASIYYMKNTTGFLSGELAYNGYLAPGNLFNDHLKDARPFATGMLINNDTEYNFTKKKNTVVNLKYPVFDFEDLDIENYLIATHNGNLFVEEININLSDGIAEIKAVK
jgi:hypothetical protein